MQPEFITIPLTKGMVAIVDREDAGLAALNWCASNTGKRWYALRQENGVRIYLHRAIMGLDGPRVDHIDGNGLNNRRSNLRHATNSQNLANAGKKRHNTSGFKGVHWYAAGKKWVASIRSNNQVTHLGYFDSAESAARAYDNAALVLHGDFAHLNFPTRLSGGAIDSITNP